MRIEMYICDYCRKVEDYPTIGHDETTHHFCSNRCGKLYNKVKDE
jgi:hypothetical protein